MMTREAAERQVRQAARTAAYHGSVTFADVRAMVPGEIGDRFVLDVCELAGYKVSSCCREPAVLGGRCETCGGWLADLFGD